MKIVHINRQTEIQDLLANESIANKHTLIQVSVLYILVDGGWSSWGYWGDCNVACGTGQQGRKRNCSDPVPDNGGVYCQGEEYENISCSTTACAGD